VSEWQPIETVPKDGIFLVVGGEWHGEIYGHDPHEKGPWIVEKRNDYMTLAATDAYTVEIRHPTHWMSLPPLPPEAP